MFWHNFVYSLKTLFKSKSLIFWTFVFPILLGTFFKLAFSNIEKNKTFILIMAFITIVQIILIYFGGTMFRTKSLTLFEFLIMLMLAITVIPIDSFRKFIYKKKYGTENV